MESLNMVKHTLLYMCLTFYISSNVEWDREHGNIISGSPDYQIYTHNIVSADPSEFGGFL